MNWHFYYHKSVRSFETLAEALDYARKAGLHGLIISNNLITKEV